MHLFERADVWQISHPGGMATSNPFPALPPSIARPDQPPPEPGVLKQGDGVLAMGFLGEMAPTRVLILPFGQGSNGATFQMNVYAWRNTSGQMLGGGSGVASALWTPLLLATYSVTLGTQTGAQGADIGPSYNFAGTITQTFGPTFQSQSTTMVDQFILSPGAGGLAHVSLRILSAQFIQITFQLGTAQGANALIARV